MSPRPHPAYALALASALVGTTPVAAGAGDPELVERCFTEALTAEEVEDGVVSDIDCYEVPADAPLARGAMYLAVQYDISSSTGADLWVTGSSCTGASINFGTGHAWDNRISAMELLACGNAKHYTGANLTGNSQLKSGLTYHTFTGAWNNVTSSIEYAP